VNKLNDVGAFHSSIHTLHEVAKFIGSRNVPVVLDFGLFEELATFEGLHPVSILMTVCAGP
jgi:hypothetical protein